MHDAANNRNMDAEETEMDWPAERLARASFKELGSPAAVEQRFLRHLLTVASCRSSLQNLLAKESKTTRDYSLEINAFDLMASDPVLGYLLLRYPATLLPILENSVVQAQRELKRELAEQQLGPDHAAIIMNYIIKGEKGEGPDNPGMTRVHARLVHLPPFCSKSSLVSMEAKDVGKIVQLGGVVVRSSTVQMYESTRTYKCEGKNGCGHTFCVYADLEQRHNALATPKCCPSVVDGGKKCKGANFQQVVGGSVHTDFQEVKIQEAASRIGVGHIPRSLLIKLQHDLVDRCQPGDEVVVVGSLLAQWQQSVAVGVDCEIGMALEAHSIKVVEERESSAWNSSEEGTSMGESDILRKEFDAYWNDPVNRDNPIAARNFISSAICPKLYGMQIIKLALLMTLIGGVSSDVYADTYDEQGYSAPDESPQQTNFSNSNAPDQFNFVSKKQTQADTTGAYNYGAERTPSVQWKSNKQQAVKTRRRDQSHMLLVGDPGTGKSQFLRFANALCPRSVLTTGVGTTSAGLTCAAVREGNGKEFVLEAGALVLADKGVCCIDEFGCIQDQDRTTIHEAMEQQTLSVAKAGIVCKLNCRATIIAVMNPKNSLYENQDSLAKNTGLGTPLLSRFDIIFKLVDTSDASRDANITRYLLNRAIQGSGFECSESDNASCLNNTPWNMEKLRGYIALVKDRFQPIMSDDAAKLLEIHYEKCRSARSSTIPTTVRFLESMIRLSQAHARLMYRNVVTLTDAVAVIRILECSAFTYGGFDANVDDIENVMYCDPMTMAYSTDEADMEFLIFEYQLLRCHGMLDKLPQSQLERMHQHMATIEATTSLFDSANPTQGWNSREHPRDRTATEDHYGRIHMSTQSRDQVHLSGSQGVNQTQDTPIEWNEVSGDNNHDAAHVAFLKDQSSSQYSTKRRKI